MYIEIRKQLQVKIQHKKNETKPIIKPTLNKEKNNENFMEDSQIKFYMNNAKRSLQEIDVDLEQLSILKFNTEQTRQDFIQLQKKQQSAKYGDTIEEKIDKLDTDARIDKLKDKVEYDDNLLQFTQKQRDELHKAYEKLKNSSTREDFNAHSRQYNKIRDSYISGKYDMRNNDFLRRIIKGRNLVRRKIEIWCVDSTDEYKPQIESHKRILIQYDADIVRDLNAYTNLTIAPDVQKLLEEYDKELKQDIANNYNFNK
ncbi:hypothetical protein HKO22_02940 [Peptoniphilus sp. AGMB00490]|uniref:Uncharacterized protein n=1 Tax=Peptoniphilus faecalis TaxID=2731255 RepID=A0A848RCZ3_9FIRM|nr:hypothetical protein [Peptoniphilus faecalis]NMW84700.1 hypothetical protein [Peptoniphilus faecalis]